MDPKDATSAATHKLRELGAFIREQRKSAQKSLRHLATEAGVSNPYLSQIERGLRKPSAEILQSIAKALRISAETLYVKAGILEEQEHDLESRILADPHLSIRQKQNLLDIYRSFRGASGEQSPEEVLSAAAEELAAAERDDHDAADEADR
jgi:transcriptional regulator with XRE-family HTH domain